MPNAKHGKKIPFTGKNLYYPAQNTGVDPSFSVAPDADACARLGPAGRVVSLLQHVCGYEDLSFNGIQVLGSVVTGMKTDLPSGGWQAQGYEWFCLINGDRALAEISEVGDEKGSSGKIKIVQGTGCLGGMTGEGTYSNSPNPNDPVVISILKGWYSLPVPKEAPTSKQRKKEEQSHARRKTR